MANVDDALTVLIDPRRTKVEKAKEVRKGNKGCEKEDKGRIKTLQ